MSSLQSFVVTKNLKELMNILTSLALLVKVSLWPQVADGTADKFMMVLQLRLEEPFACPRLLVWNLCGQGMVFSA